MMRLFLLFVLVSALTLATAASALAHNANENGFVGCGQNVENQIEMGIEAGGSAALRPAGVLIPDYPGVTEKVVAVGGSEKTLLRASLADCDS